VLVLAVVLGAVGCTAAPDAPPDRAGRSAAAPSIPPSAEPSRSSIPDPTPDPTPDATQTPPVPVRSAALDEVGAAAVVAPVSLALPAQDISLPVDPVGVAPDGQMEIPPRVERAGWYRFGPPPGGSGTAVIAAHVDSVASAGLGPFARLEDAAAGDPVDVTLADGSTLRFVVTDVRRTAKTGIDWSTVFVRQGPPRLVLITCGGAFQRDVGHYADNVIVTAEPAGGS
jgi:hypothetical protein